MLFYVRYDIDDEYLTNNNLKVKDPSAIIICSEIDFIKYKAAYLKYNVRYYIFF